MRPPSRWSRWICGTRGVPHAHRRDEARAHTSAIGRARRRFGERLKDTRASDNFRNPFELPVVLSAVVVVQTTQVTVLTLALAWTFVALRMAHSSIQCTYNKVIHRFYVYFSGGVVLWALWAVLAYGMIR